MPLHRYNISSRLNVATSNVQRPCSVHAISINQFFPMNNEHSNEILITYRLIRGVISLRLSIPNIASVDCFLLYSSNSVPTKVIFDG